MYYHPLETFKG